MSRPRLVDHDLDHLDLDIDQIDHDLDQIDHDLDQIDHNLDQIDPRSSSSYPAVTTCCARSVYYGSNSRKRVLNPAGSAAPTLQREPAHTDHTDNTDHLDHSLSPFPFCGVGILHPAQMT